MPSSKLLTLTLGVPATISTVAVCAFTIVFSSALRSHHSAQAIPAAVAASLNIISLLLFIVIVARHLFERDVRVGRSPFLQHLPECGVVVLILASGVTLATLIWMYLTLEDLPSRIGDAHTGSLVVIAFIICGVSLLAKSTVIGIIWNQCRSSLRTRAYSGTWERPVYPDIHDRAQKRMSRNETRALDTTQDSDSERTLSFEKGTLKRISSDTMTSLQSSISQAVRPMSSRTRLLTRAQRMSTRPDSTASSRLHSMTSEDGFDSWDTSNLDFQNQQTVLSTAGLTPPMPTASRFLETIPASPATSRSPSPGFPLETLEPLEPLEPPFGRRRSRSQSPASFRTNSGRGERSNTPSSSEAHIHPLFRTDSPDPPPNVTPGTVVTAAPGAGVVISDRASIRSLKRMRSGSLPSQSSPLANAGSYENLAAHIIPEVPRRESPEIIEESQEETERPLTPSIPGWILDSGRNSMIGYTKRKASAEAADDAEEKELAI